MVMRISEDILVIIVLTLITDILLEKLGLYESANAIIASRKIHAKKKKKY